MDSPVKSVGSPSTTGIAPVSRLEDSPIYNYINKLSPIKPLNSGQPINLLGFASPKTLVTSIATNCPNKNKITVCQFSFPFKSNSSDGVREGRKNQANDLPESNDIDVLPMETDGKQDSLKSGVGIKVESACDENAEMSTEICDYVGSNGHGGYDYKCDAADYNSVCRIVESETVPDLFFQEYKDYHTFIDNNQRKGVGCSWEKKLVEVDQLLCEFPFDEGDPEESVNKYADSEIFSFMENMLQLPQENIDEPQKIDSSPPGYSELHDVKVPLTHPSGAEWLCEAGQSSTCARAVDRVDPNTRASVNKKMLPRRSLAFEMFGNQSRKLPSETSLTSGRSSFTAIASEKQPVSSKFGDYSFSPLLPGIGLHLNTLVNSRRETILIKKELTSERQMIGMPCTSSVHSSSPDPELMNSPVDREPKEEDIESITTEQKLNETVHHNSAFTKRKESKQNSTKKKRCKPEIAEEGGSCKRCNCKRSKCLKLYCECFAAGLYCVDPCSCQGCLNKPDFEETVMETRKQIESRNPLAFAPKVIRISDISEYEEETKTTPASARHKRGCNCKKSGCLKKYCECFQGGVGCSLSCRCEGCKNSFGQKDGYHTLVLEETEASENNSSDLRLREVVRDDFEHQDPQATLSSQISRNQVFPVSLASRFPTFSSGLLQPCTNHSLGKKTYSFSHKGNFAAPTPLKMTVVDKADMDENDISTSATIKSMSPNSKRVLPRHGPSNPPVRKFCRKLILRSIPSFPKLSDHTDNGISREKTS